MQLVDRRISTSILESHRDTVRQIRDAWRSGSATPDAEGAIESLGGIETLHKSIILDLAYEEFCIRREAGEEIDCGEFIGRFPNIALSLRRQICVHDALAERGVLDVDAFPEWPVAGDEISGFLLTDELGRGSFGRVFLAREMQLHERQVVVKIAQHGQHEAQLLAQVPHAGVVPVYSVSRDAEWGLTTLCMPFISRATLLDVIESIHGEHRRPTHAWQIADAARSQNCVDDNFMALAEPEQTTKRGTFADAVCVFGYLAASALQATHNRQIFHRDIKPSNILVDQFGCPMLIDFNLSAEPRADGPLGGTLPYMAPEQLLQFKTVLQSKKLDASCENIDGKADVFSLGVCLFELLYGIYPFAPVPLNADNQELADYLLSKYAEGPLCHPAGDETVDTPLRSIIRRCLNFDPARRPTAAELAEALQQTRSIGNRVTRMAKVHPSLAKATIGVTLASILTAAVGMAVQPNELETLKSSAAQSAIAGEYHAAVDHLTNALNLAPDDLEIRKARGEARMHLQQYQSALDDLTVAYDESPSSRLASRIAWCQAELQNYGTAARLYEQLVEEFPDSAVLHNNLGYVLSRDMQLPRAIDHFNRALEIDDQLSVCYLNRAESVFRQAILLKAPTPVSALKDVQKSGRSGTSGTGRILLCRICATLECPNEDEIIAAIDGCASVRVPRDRLESDPLLHKLWKRSKMPDALSILPVEGTVTRPRRLIPPFR